MQSAFYFIQIGTGITLHAHNGTFADQRGIQPLRDRLPARDAIRVRIRNAHKWKFVVVRTSRHQAFSVSSGIAPRSPAWFPSSAARTWTLPHGVQAYFETYSCTYGIIASALFITPPPITITSGSYICTNPTASAAHTFKQRSRIAIAMASPRRAASNRSLKSISACDASELFSIPGHSFTISGNAHPEASASAQPMFPHVHFLPENKTGM